MAGGQAGARQHQARVAVGNRDGHAGADDRALPRRELCALARRQIEARVALVGLRGEHGILAQARDRQLRSGAFRAEPSPASATR